MDISDYLRFVMALVFVVGLIGVLAVLARRLGMGYRGPVRRGAGRRLSISEVMPLDAKRRLVLVRRDDVEHLILLGGESDVLVERAIREGGAEADEADTDFGRTLAQVEARTQAEAHTQTDGGDTPRQ